MSKNVPNRVQTCYEVIFWNHHALQGGKMEKNEKKSDFWNFKSVQKRS